MLLSLLSVGPQGEMSPVSTESSDFLLESLAAMVMLEYGKWEGRYVAIWTSGLEGSRKMNSNVDQLLRFSRVNLRVLVNILRFLRASN